MKNTLPKIVQFFLFIGIILMVSVTVYATGLDGTSGQYIPDDELALPTDPIEELPTEIECPTEIEAPVPTETDYPVVFETELPTQYEPTEFPTEAERPSQPDIPEELPANSPTIHIYTEDSNGVTLQKEDGYVNAFIYVVNTDGSLVEGEAKIKVRGNSTAMSNVLKKAFNIKFTEKKDLFGMGKGKKWCLMSNPFDQTLLRNYVAFEFARELGLENTSKQQFAQLYLDDSFRGLYVVTEPVEEGKDRVDIDIESNNGMNDFLIELEDTRVESDVKYFNCGELRFAAKEPEEPNDEQLAYMESTMQDVYDTIVSGTQEEIEQKIDVESFADYYVLNELVKTVDFGFSSVYFYYKDSKLYAGPPWDYDFAMGGFNPNVSLNYKSAYDTQGLYAYDKNFYIYLCKYDWFNEIAKRSYEENFEKIYNIYCENGLIDSTASRYAEEINRNYTETPWTVTKRYYNYQRVPEDTYEGNVEYLKNWLAERNLWLINYFEPFAGEYELGDADGNEIINILDATIIQRQLASIDTERPAMVALRGDGDRNGLDVIDATKIQNYLAKLITEV